MARLRSYGHELGLGVLPPALRVPLQPVEAGASSGGCGANTLGVGGSMPSRRRVIVRAGPGGCSLLLVAATGWLRGAGARSDASAAAGSAMGKRTESAAGRSRDSGEARLDARLGARVSAGARPDELADGGAQGLSGDGGGGATSGVERWLSRCDGGVCWLRGVRACAASAGGRAGDGVAGSGGVELAAPCHVAWQGAPGAAGSWAAGVGGPALWGSHGAPCVAGAGRVPTMASGASAALCRVCHGAAQPGGVLQAASPECGMAGGGAAAAGGGTGCACGGAGGAATHLQTGGWQWPWDPAQLLRPAKVCTGLRRRQATA